MERRERETHLVLVSLFLVLVDRLREEEERCGVSEWSGKRMRSLDLRWGCARRESSCEEGRGGSQRGESTCVASNRAHMV